MNSNHSEIGILELSRRVPERGPNLLPHSLHRNLLIPFLSFPSLVTRSELHLGQWDLFNSLRNWTSSVDLVLCFSSYHSWNVLSANFSIGEGILFFFSHAKNPWVLFCFFLFMIGDSSLWGRDRPNRQTQRRPPPQKKLMPPPYAAV